MDSCLVFGIALGMALGATGAWAQNPPALSALTCDNDHPCGLGPSVTAGEGVELVNKGSVPLRVDLSPDQKLARAYAMCTKSAIDSMTQGVVHEMLPNAPLPQEASQACRAIMVSYEQSHEHQSDADRAFIEEVARGLK